jgi:hypothetical protein
MPCSGSRCRNAEPHEATTAAADHSTRLTGRDGATDFMKIRRARPGSSHARRTNSRPVKTRPRVRRAGLDIWQFAVSQIHAGCGLPSNRYRSLNSSVPLQRGQGRVSPLTGRSAARRSCAKRRVLVLMWTPQGLGVGPDYTHFELSSNSHATLAGCTDKRSFRRRAS